MKTELIKVNDHLSFLLKHTKKGMKIKCFYDDMVIGVKPPCEHNNCNVRFVAEMSIAADQMHRFEKVFEPDENLN